MNKIPKEYYPEILFIIFLVVMLTKVYIMVQLANGVELFS
tara:strand:+ start:5516 stop:5635 length:120 start_codon:yes stop_codon:yes gene_type:complete